MSTSLLEKTSCQDNEKVRLMVSSSAQTILGNIYHDDTNLAVWQRDLSSSFQDSIRSFLIQNPKFQLRISVTPETVDSSLKRVFGSNKQTYELVDDIAELVDMYCFLFELKQAGLRLSVLEHAMCPRFHVDRVPCRLVTTYVGSGSEWLAHENLDRSKLGTGNKGLSDEESGIYHCKDNISRLSEGDVALLKGELWENNEGAGLVHRSPALIDGELRLLLTLDFL